MFDDEMKAYTREDFPEPEDIEQRFTATNSSCDDRATLTIGTTIGIEVDGCLVCQAAAAKTAEQVEDEGIEPLQRMDEEEYLDFLGWDLTPMRRDCALTPFRALQDEGTNL